MAPDERWVVVNEVAAHFCVDKDSTHRWVGSRGLPARKVGRLLRSKLSQIDAWIEAASGEGNGSESSLSARPVPYAGRRTK